MKTDPNLHCVKFVQNNFWALIHDVVAHPLMALTLYCKPSIAFHDWTSAKAWHRIDSGD